MGGLLLNFTPCVLPVIPIKVMSLSRAAGVPPPSEGPRSETTGSDPFFRGPGPGAPAGRRHGGGRRGLLARHRRGHRHRQRVRRGQLAVPAGLVHPRRGRGHRRHGPGHDGPVRHGPAALGLPHHPEPGDGHGLVRAGRDDRGVVDALHRAVHGHRRGVGDASTRHHHPRHLRRHRRGHGPAVPRPRRLPAPRVEDAPHRAGQRAHQAGHGPVHVGRCGVLPRRRADHADPHAARPAESGVLVGRRRPRRRGGAVADRPHLADHADRLETRRLDHRRRYRLRDRHPRRPLAHPRRAHRLGLLHPRAVRRRPRRGRRRGDGLHRGVVPELQGARAQRAVQRPRRRPRRRAGGDVHEGRPGPASPTPPAGPCSTASAG